LKSYGYWYWSAAIFTLGLMIGPLVFSVVLHLLGEPFSFGIFQSSWFWSLIISLPVVAFVGYRIRGLRPTRDEAVVISGLILLIAGAYGLYMFIGFSFISGLLGD
jgi:hypothetical protein